MATALASIHGQLVTATDLQPDVRASAPEIGSCASVTGPLTSIVFTRLPCDDAEASHRVVQVVRDPSSCVADVDQKYYTNTSSGEWSACLDYNWTTSRCIDRTGDNAATINCDESTKDHYRPTKVIVGDGTGSKCQDGGFAHKVRKFSICTTLTKAHSESRQ
ncbi:MAG: LppU/SCO3897 family protein [Mycobacteriaceae bacterium]